MYFETNKNGKQQNLGTHKTESEGMEKDIPLKSKESWSSNTHQIK